MNTEISYLDKLKTKSQYHFDNTRWDKPGEWFTVHGKFINNWQTELEEIQKSTQPLTWRNISSALHKTPQALPGSEREERVRSQELDILRGGGDPELELADVNTDVAKYSVFDKMTKFFGLERASSRVHVQRTGQVFNLHLDDYSVGYPGVNEDQLIRFIVMLEDWVPGHFYMYGTCPYTHWQAGEFHSFRWQDVPHCTSNASDCVRTSLIITGVKTAKTESILQSDYQNYSLESLV